MLLTIPDVLTPDQAADFRRQLDRADWIDGAATAGAQSGAVKHNQQLDHDDALARKLGDAILGALANNPRFISAALPAKIFPPLFNKYEHGGNFGAHVDNAIRAVPGTPTRIRTDLSATLFLAAPETYAGGELEIETPFGAQAVKLPAGSMVLYPSSSLHRVTPVTSGARIAAFFWVQSMIRLAEDRAILFDMDQSIQALAAEKGMNDAVVLSLSAAYHNLVRRLADA
ncbi:MAG: Fe2+-dependent dioxygenase [Parvularculaceae bacterium]